MPSDAHWTGLGAHETELTRPCSVDGSRGKRRSPRIGSSHHCCNCPIRAQAPSPPLRPLTAGLRLCRQNGSRERCPNGFSVRRACRMPTRGLHKLGTPYTGHHAGDSASWAGCASSLCVLMRLPKRTRCLFWQTRRRRATLHRAPAADPSIARCRSQAPARSGSACQRLTAKRTTLMTWMRSH